MYIQTQTNDTMEHWSPHPSRQLILWNVRHSSHLGKC